MSYTGEQLPLKRNFKLSGWNFKGNIFVKFIILQTKLKQAIFLLP